MVQDFPVPDFINAETFGLPDTLSFAGEPVPLNLKDVYERLDREIHINIYWHTNTIFMMKRAHRWLPQMSAILREEGIPDDFKYLVAIESNFQNDISDKAAVGFWQFRKNTAKEYGLEVSPEVDERYNPIKSTHAACLYFIKAHKKFGTWTLAAASYNRGSNGLQKALDNQKVGSYYDLMLNDETSRYVFRVLAAKEVIEHSSKYGFEINEDDLYNEEPAHMVEVDSTISNLVDWSIAQGINYKILRRFNPWLQKNRLTVRKGNSYQIALPGNADD